MRRKRKISRFLGNKKQKMEERHPNQPVNPDGKSTHRAEGVCWHTSQ